MPRRREASSGWVTGSQSLYSYIYIPGKPVFCLESIFLCAGATISDLQWRMMEAGHYNDNSIHPYVVKVMTAGGFKAYAKAHRQKLVAMFVRTRCFQPVPDEIVPLIVDYGFHVGFY